MGAERSGRVLIGTTSWAERSLLEQGHFYPPAVRTPEQRLRYYASVFPVVEVDSTFYGLPSERNAVLWTERTPPGFVLDVKAHRLLTRHRTPVRSLPADLRGALESGRADVYYEKVPREIREEVWRRFRAGLEPLRASGRLGVVLFQLAPWVTFGKDGLEHLALCAEHMQGIRIAVELRNVSWLGERHRAQTLAALRKLGAAHVVVDEPQGTSFSVPPVWEVTRPDVAVVRLHGRDRGAWLRKDLATAADRYAYLYSDDELRSFVAPVERLASEAGEVHVLFNNCHRDWAQTNAARFDELVQGALELRERPEAGQERLPPGQPGESVDAQA